MNTLPILMGSQPDTTIFNYKDELITHEKFKQDACCLAENLQQHKYAINLCEDRYLFTLGFVACMLQKQICLMPASSAEKEIESLEQDYADTQRINDALLETLLSSQTKTENCFPAEINANQVVAILFTSGSSGKPQANPKQWGTLVDSAQRVASQLNLNKPAQHTLIATVPPQHMYGFEMTVILPLVAAVCVHSGKPFFPEDIRHTLELVNKPAILVTTPIHLRACVQEKFTWPAIDFVLSATAPLSVQLAKKTEQQLQTTVREIYGCSEAGVIATRTTTQNPDWLLLTGYAFVEKPSGVCLLTPGNNEGILLPDQVEKIDPRHFHLLGRQTDIVKIAGKRGSLNDLKIKLCALEGIHDAIFFMPDGHPDEKARLAAFVVAPNLCLEEITSFFSKQIDKAFVPRPFIKVEKIPYNEIGKIPRKDLLTLLKQRHKPLKNSA
jgi:acyl-coenzyme A synthetase/AMP-(fatty) acid ligase